MFITFNKQKVSYLKARVTFTYGIRIYPRDFHFDSGEFIDVRIPASKLLQVMYGSN